MTSPVFITGIGAMTSIGNTVTEQVNSLRDKRSGYGSIDMLATLHASRLGACEIKLDNDALCARANVLPGKGYTRTSLLALTAMKEAMDMAGLSGKDIEAMGLFSATTTGGIREFEKHFDALLDPMQTGPFLQYVDTANPGEHAERLADHFSIKKYVATLSTACSSSANSLMMGAQWIQSGKLERAICGGADALSKFTINGFNALMILDPAPCRPFDQTRAGLNLGEGAAYLVLESEASVLRRKARPLGILAGYGNANDAYHQTASSPDGKGALVAMKMALDRAGIQPSQVGYVNAHGTATENNDLSEGLALQQLFGPRVPPFSSTKPYTGHTLAAAGGVEGVFSILSLLHHAVFPNLNFSVKMDELDIRPETEFRTLESLDYVLSNSFGFGGNTSSLLFARV